jgi:hypothetical protein
MLRAPGKRRVQQDATRAKGQRYGHVFVASLTIWDTLCFCQRPSPASFAALRNTANDFPPALQCQEMWSRFTSALKPKEAQPSQSDIITKVHEQHPNMSMFQANETGVIEVPPDLPPSPSVHSKKSMFKRMSRNALNDADLRAHLPTAGPPALPPKGFSSNANGMAYLNFQWKANSNTRLRFPSISWEQCHRTATFARHPAKIVIRHASSFPRQRETRS